MTSPLFVFPCDPLNSKLVDDHFTDERAAARDAGHDTALVDHDSLSAGRGAEVRRPRSDEPVPAWYRGWMLGPDAYTRMAADLEARNIILVTDPAMFRAAHQLPGWHGALADHTAPATWGTGDSSDAFEEVRAAFGPGPAVLRDYTKSAKHHWDEACYIPDVADHGAAHRVAARFRDLRGDDFAGGYVLRRYEHYVGSEARTWWVNGTCVAVTAHPDTADDIVDVPAAALEDVGPAVAGLGLRFVTVDLTLDRSGRWRIVELGDGQVSDRPGTLAPEALVAALT